jgi:hypothetical protein
MINNNKGALGALLLILAVLIIIAAVFSIVTLLGYDSDDDDSDGQLPVNFVDTGDNVTNQEPEINHISSITGSFSGGSDGDGEDNETTARWGVLADVKLGADPSNGEVVYDNILGYCTDEDEDAPIVVNVVSNHNHYGLLVVGNDLLIYNFDGTPLTETVILDCNGAEAEFDLTVCHEVDFGFGSTIIC